MKKKLFLKSRFWKKFCTEKITFWFNLPRKIRKLCVLRAFLKSTILKKKFFLKSMILNVKFSLKSLILNEKVFVKSMILNLKFFLLSDFESTFLKRVRFWVKNFTTCQILNQISNWICYNVSDFECTSFAVCQIFIHSSK